jgi:16S rRNA processing protein RimM
VPPAPPAPGAGRIEVGFVARAHGIRGELLAVPHDPASRTLAGARAVWIGGRRYPVRAARATPRGFLILVEGVDDRTAAEGLRGAALEVEREEIPLAEGEVLLADLVGCRAQLPDGTPWGEIVALALGPQVRLVVRDGDVERELPLVEALVPAIDLAGRVVTVDPPDGLPETPAQERRR